MKLTFNAAKPFFRSLCSLYKYRNILICAGGWYSSFNLVVRPKRPPNVDHLEYHSLMGKEGLISSQLEEPSWTTSLVRTPPSARHRSCIYGWDHLQQGGTRYGCNIWSGGADYSTVDSPGGPLFRGDCPRHDMPTSSQNAIRVEISNQL